MMGKDWDKFTVPEIRTWCVLCGDVLLMPKVVCRECTFGPLRDLYQAFK